MSDDKFIFSLLETTQIIYGPCKRKASEYARVIRLVKNGKLRSIRDGTRFWITREALVDFVKSEKIFNDKLKSLYAQKIFTKFVPVNDRTFKKKLSKNDQNKMNVINENEVYNKNELNLYALKPNKNLVSKNQITWLKEAFQHSKLLRKDLAIHMGVKTETISRYMTKGKNFIKLSVENANKIFEFFGYGDLHQLFEIGSIQTSIPKLNVDKSSDYEKILNHKKSLSKALGIKVEDITISVNIPAKSIKL